MQGVLGAFHEIDSAVHAIEDLKEQRFGDITVFTPTPRHEFEHVMKHPPSKVRLVTLVFGLAGVTFGYWIAVWISDYWPIVVGGKGLATVFAMFAMSHVPRLTTTVGYDERFSGGHFGVWVVTDPDRADDAMGILKKHGAEEVRRER
jgi:hypothetical protein